MTVPDFTADRIGREALARLAQADHLAAQLRHHPTAEWVRTHDGTEIGAWQVPDLIAHLLRTADVLARIALVAPATP